MTKKKPEKKIKPIKIQTDYLGKVYDVNKFQIMIGKLVKKICEFKRKNPFEAIAFTGTSGAAAAYAVSYKLKIPLICVRKKDRNHYGQSIEGATSAASYIILDDFIAGGSTVRRIIETLAKNHHRKPLKLERKPVGIFLYDDYGRYTELDDVPIIRI